MSDSSPRAVSISTGVPVFGPLLRRALHSVSPSTRAASGRARPDRSGCRRDGPGPRDRRRRQCASSPSRPRCSADQLADVRVVFDDQDMGHGNLLSILRARPARRPPVPHSCHSGDLAMPRMSRLLGQEPHPRPCRAQRRLDGGGEFDDQDMADGGGRRTRCRRWWRARDWRRWPRRVRRVPAGPAAWGGAARADRAAG